MGKEGVFGRRFWNSEDHIILEHDPAEVAAIKNRISPFTSGLTQNDRVLDLGCGAFSLEYLDGGFPSWWRSVTFGVDFSIEALRKNEILKKAVGEIQRLPFADDSFKLVTSFFSLRLVAKEDFPRLVREISRVAQPHAKFVGVDFQWDRCTGGYIDLDYLKQLLAGGFESIKIKQILPQVECCSPLTYVGRPQRGPAYLFTGRRKFRAG